MPGYRITCPYCFREFDDGDVHFRMETVVNDIKDVVVKAYFGDGDTAIYRSPADVDQDLELSEDMRRKLLSRFAVLSGFGFVQGEDPAYSMFWKRYGGVTTEYIGVDDMADMHQLPWLRSVHDPNAEPEFFSQTAEISASGLTNRIRDVNGRYTDRRVCPYCHNPLPKEYGQYPVKHIAVVGLSGAGKTVYLSQLCGFFEAECRRIGIRVVPLFPNVWGYRQINIVAESLPLPAPTPSQSLQQPLCFNLTYTSTSSKQYHLTLVLHDVSGRNCEVDSGGSSLSRNAARYAPFLEHADALMLMVDSTQLYMSNTLKGPQAVLNVLRDLYAGRTKLFERLPIAVCLTKGDIAANQIFGGPLREMNPASDGGLARSCVFNAEDYNRIHEALIKFVKDKLATLDNALSVQLKYNLFIVSALGTGTRLVDTENGTRNVPFDIPAPKRLIEPLLWILHQLGFIGSTGFVNELNDWLCPQCSRRLHIDQQLCPDCKRDRNGRWVCPLCGTVNEAGATQCAHTEKGFLGMAKRCKGVPIR